jgi:hypothetical protein
MFTSDVVLDFDSVGEFYVHTVTLIKDNLLAKSNRNALMSASPIFAA